MKKHCELVEKELKKTVPLFRFDLTRKYFKRDDYARSI